MPILDQAADTFESLRDRTPVCLLAVPFLCLRQIDGHAYQLTTDQMSSVRHRCLLECRRLAPNSLFENPIMLENIQAMILLAGHAPKTWFAIGHAHQMAIDLNLDSALAQLVDLHQSVSQATSQRRQGSVLRRKVRTWLALCCVERQLALGTSRSPRTLRIERTLVESYLKLPICRSSDVSLLSSVDLVDLCGMFTLPASLFTSTHGRY